MPRTRFTPILLLAGLLALLAAPAAPRASANGSVTLNSSGGNQAFEPPRIVVHASSVALIHAGQLYSGGSESAPRAGFVYYANGTLYGAPHLTALSAASTKSDWDSATVTELSADTQAQQVLVAGSTTFTITYNSTPFTVDAYTIEFSGGLTSGTHGLYFVADTKVLGRTANTYVGTDLGLGESDVDDRYMGIYADGLLYFSGMGITNDPGDEGRPDATMYGSVDCVFGKASGCPSRGPENGSAYSGDQPGTSDGAVGVYYNLVDRTVFTGFSYGAAAVPMEAPPSESAELPAAQCLNSTDVAVSPAEITLAPGGSATVEVAVRNTDAQPQGYHDLVLSLSDGLSVSAVSDGVNLGQRAALQGFVLQPNETRTMSVQVSAAATLPTAPLHVTELYCGGQVVSRIDGVFLPPPALAVAPAVVVPTAEPVTAAPAPPVLPSALPNTAAGQRGLAPLWPLLAGLIMAGVLLRRRS